MPAATLQTVTYRDSRGFTSTIKFRVTGTDANSEATSAQAVITTISALTTLALQSQHGAANLNSTEAVYPTPATYQDVEDKANFTFQTASGALHNFKIPGPKAAIFLADGKTVDPSNSLVTAYTSAVIANCVDDVGNPIAFGGVGSRLRSKTKRKLNKFTKNPQLTTPDL